MSRQFTDATFIGHNVNKLLRIERPITYRTETLVVSSLVQSILAITKSSNRNVPSPIEQRHYDTADIGHNLNKLLKTERPITYRIGTLLVRSLIQSILAITWTNSSKLNVPSPTEQRRYSSVHWYNTYWQWPLQTPQTPTEQRHYSSVHW